MSRNPCVAPLFALNVNEVRRRIRLKNGIDPLKRSRSIWASDKLIQEKTVRFGFSSYESGTVFELARTDFVPIYVADGAGSEETEGGGVRVLCALHGAITAAFL